MPRKSLPPDPAQTELAIVGGGLSGLLLAIACAGAGIETVLIDRQAPAAMKGAGYDGRTTAIAYGSQQVLSGIGLWDALAREAEPIREIRVADGRSPFFLHYDHRELGDAPLGYIVENQRLRRALIDRAQELDALTLLAPLGVVGCEASASAASLRLSDGRVLRASLVIGADGRNSPLREAAGICSLRKNYGQTAIVCTVRHELPHHGVAVEHFRGAGPFAILPMRMNRSSIVWTERSEDAQHILALDENGFARELATRFGDHLGALAIEGERWSYPLALLRAERIIASRLALVGDAAHVIHPIAGQGWNLGVRDVAALAELLVDAVRLGLDLGADSLLERYERWRRVDNLTLTAVTDGLNRLFTIETPPVRLVRDLGLAAVNRAPLAKRFLMRHAMGLVGDAPRLVRGAPL